MRSGRGSVRHAHGSGHRHPRAPQARPHSSPTTATRTAHAVRSVCAGATTATMPCGVVQRGDSRQAVQSLHSHADLLLTKKSPPAIALVAGKPSCGLAETRRMEQRMPVYVRTFPLAPLPAGCMPFFITRGTQRGFTINPRLLQRRRP